MAHNLFGVVVGCGLGGLLPLWGEQEEEMEEEEEEERMSVSLSSTDFILTTD